MKKIIAMCCFVAFACADGISGYYLLPKNERGAENIVQIFEYNHKYYAYGFAEKNHKDAGLDTKNPNPELRKRHLGGVVFLWNLEKKDETHFADGKIYNYVNGKTYHAKMELKGDRLILKASADSSGLFGKTFEWKKLDDKEVQPYLKHTTPLEKVILTIPESKN